MPRQEVHPSTPFAFAGRASRGTAPAVRSPAARRWGRTTALLLAPFAAALAAIAGLAYVLLLPVCGIASIASAVAHASWAVLREAFRGARERTAPRA
ncbi:MAG TPA: hypothetical protein VIV57_18215 [Anaeromyxobacter sp.]